jgi:hypothetical protein
MARSDARNKPPEVPREDGAVLPAVGAGVCLRRRLGRRRTNAGPECNAFSGDGRHDGVALPDPDACAQRSPPHAVVRRQDTVPASARVGAYAVNARSAAPRVRDSTKRASP